MSEVRIALVFGALALAVTVGCSEQSAKDAVQSAEEHMDAAGEKLEENVDRSNEILEETYDKARAEGEGAVEAAGDAYNAMLEEPEKEKEAEKATQ